MTIYLDHVFICLFAVYVSSLMSCLLRSLAHFKFFIFLLLSLKDSLYILDNSTLWLLSFANIFILLLRWWTSLVAQLLKNLPAIWETWVWSLGWKIPYTVHGGLKELDMTEWLSLSFQDDVEFLLVLMFPSLDILSLEDRCLCRFLAVSYVLTSFLLDLSFFPAARPMIFTIPKLPLLPSLYNRPKVWCFPLIFILPSPAHWNSVKYSFSMTIATV